MKKLKVEVSKSLHIKSKGECTTLVDTVMEVNEKEWKQQFSGVEISKEVMKAFKKDMFFHVSTFI